MAKKGGAPENLKPVRTTEEAKKRGAAGGKKSGEARRRKRDAQSAARLILNLPCLDKNEQNLKLIGVYEEDYTNRVALMARAFALAMSGSESAMRFLIEMAGESPRFKLEEKRTDAMLNPKENTTSLVDEWVNSIPDLPMEDEE